MLVLLGEDHEFGRELPVNVQCRIGKQDSSIRFGMIKLITLLRENSRFGKYRETMRKTLRNKELTVIVLVELDGKPLAKSRTVLAQINRNIQHPSPRTTYKLRLRERRTLEMQAAHHSETGTRLIVLHKPRRYTGVKITLFVVGFNKITASVRKDFGLDDEKTGNGSGEDVHNLRFGDLRFSDLFIFTF